MKLLSCLFLLIVTVFHTQVVFSLQPYSHSKALKYYKFSNIAYCLPGDIQSWTCTTCLSTSSDFQVLAVPYDTTLNVQVFEVP